MLRNKIFFSFLLVIILTLSIALPLQAADDLIGCCEKFHTGQPQPDAEETTEQRCQDIKVDYENTVWHKNHVSINNQCQPKLTPPGEMRDIDAPIEFTPKITIPGSTFNAGETMIVPENTTLLANYILAIFKYSIGVIGIISAIVLMYGGVRWLTASGNSSAVTEAKNWIIGSLSGLILTFGSFLLLSTINTNLTTIKIVPVTKIEKLDLTNQGCCKKANNTYETTTSDKCTPETQGQAVEFFRGQVALGDKCGFITGCCHIQVNKWQVGLWEGPTEKEYCVNGIKQSECESKQTGKWRQLPFLQAVGAGDIDTDFGEVGVKCQDWEDECRKEGVKIYD